MWKERKREREENDDGDGYFAVLLGQRLKANCWDWIISEGCLVCNFVYLLFFVFLMFFLLLLCMKN